MVPPRRSHWDKPSVRSSLVTISEEKMAVEVLGVSISRGSGSEEPQPGEVPG
jgi:hypothetical protein